MNNSVKIEVEYLHTANYALFYNRIPICQSVNLTNLADDDAVDVTVSISGEFVGDFTSAAVGRINPGETVRVAPVSVVPDAAKLAAITERVLTEFTVTVRAAGQVIGEATCPLELMPYDHWVGTTMLPQTVASFITPNNPAVGALIVKAAAQLKNLTGSSTLSGYQSGNTNTVRMQVAAVFAALHELGLVYRGVPASFETVGQRVVMPDQVIASKVGNCLELTLLMASVLEAIGLNTLVIFQEGHAFLGVWLVDDCLPCSVSDDPSYIEKKCSRGIDEMLVIEATRLTQDSVSFEEAVSCAEHNLANHKLFELFVDVKRSRLERVMPLPSRIEQNGIWTFVTEGLEHDSCTLDVKEHDRYDLNHVGDSERELTKFDIWERKLLDFSLRNSLLNLSMRRRAIQFISFDINIIEDNLQRGVEYNLLPKPNVEIHLDPEEKLVRSKLYDDLRDLVITDIRRCTLHTYQTENETKTTLKHIHRTARASLEETGANSLFLVLGTLRWFESDQSEKPRYAPILLLPVDLLYKRGGYYLRTRDEDITLNITLIEFLRQNYDIPIPGLDPLPTDRSGVDVPMIFALIREALKEKKRWDVEEECILGIFSFSKFLMWNDVHSHRDELSENDIISSLVANRLTWKPAAMSQSLKEIDGKVAPIKTAVPVPVDSSQMAAVIEGGKGHSFILYGPPGTGKSQTITNLIANALYHGKRVLFVAEKMAALSVVQSRLEKIGLDPFCLELHSNKSTKRHLLEQLEKALNVSHLSKPRGFAAMSDKLFEARKSLIEFIDAVHLPDAADGLSVYDCILRYESISVEPMEGFKFEPKIDELLVSEGTAGIETLLGSRLQTVIKVTGQPSAHPLLGMQVDPEMIADSEEFTERILRDAEFLEEIAGELTTLREAKKLRERILCNNSEAIFERDPNELNQQWRCAKSKWFLPRYFAKKKFINELKQYNPYIVEAEIDGLIEDLREYGKLHARIKQLHGVLNRYDSTEYALDELPKPSLIKDLSVKLRRWGENASRMRDWYHWSELANVLRSNGLGCVVAAFESREVDPATISDPFLKALLRYKIDRKISRDKKLFCFEGMVFDECVASYRSLAERFRTLTQKELFARLAAQIPFSNEEAETGSELSRLRRYISNGGRGVSMRALLDRLPTLIPRLCPCMLMSPMSVAQYIDLKAEKFDLVVFDEASQIPTSEAVGAIARGKSVIVVGDPKQMPPTSFFSAGSVEVEDSAIDDMESILEDCRTLDFPSLQLSWHYRSRHESLIAFSNMEYYDGSLITFPSVDDRTSKVHFVPVKGVYDKGGHRSNRVEAQAIVAEVVRRLRDSKLRKQSLGIIAFSVSQQSLIEDILQDALEGSEELREAAANMHEPIFVKNLENVQGDERDVILFSIGYGPDKNGKISMNFGPLNNAGGERRLNVAVSRARMEMYVFSALRAADIDLQRSKARGVEGLKHFLEYAETRSLPIAMNAHSAAGSTVIAEQIAAELRRHGFNVVTNVGRSQFRVDIAVEKADQPGNYVLGILLDGEGYRDTPTTRDREMVQPSVLKSLNWTLLRVWTLDWFHSPAAVLSRILSHLNHQA